MEQRREVDVALSRFAGELARLPEVVAVSQAVEGAIHRISTFVRRRDKTIRRRIYLKELEFLEACPAISFDFNVVALEDLRAWSHQ